MPWMIPTLTHYEQITNACQIYLKKMIDYGVAGEFFDCLHLPIRSSSKRSEFAAFNVWQNRKLPVKKVNLWASQLDYGTHSIDKGVAEQPDLTPKTLKLYDKHAILPRN